ncbi:glycoside hydrolase family 127 protein [Calocera viscosa TUFC12733]|uniref:Glycoside hydrolase family 127 protein n=1 Tax=Calocera viscosa (strain TUFC12733) TaxID=1330018 RepID=A0A167N0E7_CALVF|nr:glycoside hydrolase family 127 protein [Calocera viscosa TUFC12733]
MSTAFAPASVSQTAISSPFWSLIQTSMRTRTLPAIIDSLRTTGRAYALTWTKDSAPTTPHPFWDSDVYKTLEACCYYLMKTEDKHLREFVDESVKIIRHAQHEDGCVYPIGPGHAPLTRHCSYINSYYTVSGIDQRFTNLRDRHELYQLGHLCEAAVAHRVLTGTDDLLSPALKYVSLVARLFGPNEGQKRGYPGHEEVEIGLMRIYELTGRKECLDLAGFFILERGRRDGKGEIYYDHEARARGADPYDAWSAEYKHFYDYPRDYGYQQAHKPLLEQEEIVGHSVRAMYNLTAASDYALASGNTAVLAAVKRLYLSTVRRKMYVTGGIGSIERSEGFTDSFWLPDQEEGGCAYSETCASFALALLSQRLLRHELRGEYGDVLETALYNAVLGAVSAEALGGASDPASSPSAQRAPGGAGPAHGSGEGGVAFYYQNPLTTFSGHGKARSKWFDVACCPPNVAKVFGLLGELAYSYSEKEKKLAVHFFVSSEWTARGVHVKQETALPWSGTVRLTINSKSPVALAVRIPGWARDSYTSSVQGTVQDGYLHLPPRAWAGESVELDFLCVPRRVFPHPRTGKVEVAIARGPLVYCAEGVDNPSLPLHATGLVLSSPLSEEPPQALAGIPNVPVIVAKGRAVDESWWEDGALYTDEEERARWGEVREVRLVPYFLRANRGGDGAMQVWLKRI